MSRSVFEMHSVELFCHRPLGACYVICDEWHYKACLGKAADLHKARAETREFLGMAALNQRKWQEDLTLVRRLIDRRVLAFHGVRNWNPDTDGWWIIKALLDDVRRGARLAIKGPRADLFPPPHSTPLGNLAARAVGFPNGEPMLSGRNEPATRQTGLIAARAAMDGSDLADDGRTSTLPRDAQPFAYIPDAVSGKAEELAASTNNPRFAAKMLGYDYKTFGTMLHKFKDRNGLGPADNSIFHDNGDVEFKGRIFEDSIHDYAP
ncbi:hypothetical protein CI15_09965 [Paraburkholderia monticola]|uniref:Uncharacterized protein n=1 Tax=Paraburkholderia monticola TaxID=1399968 RepID=A0A149PW98_9BURK|nr:hypothetical protein [Paraburkholderia monticola]KXU89340.1 hypothetical protein CI15_09965 [Paraburkholderia monticola]